MFVFFALPQFSSQESLHRLLVPYCGNTIEQRLNHFMQIISARHLPRGQRGFSSPFVEVEVSGLMGDNASYITGVVADNGLCPVWNESVQFKVAVPEMACLRFVVQEKDMFGDPRPIGQACFFLGSREYPMVRSGTTALLCIGDESMSG